MQLIYRGFCYTVAESAQSVCTQQVMSSATLLYRGNRYQLTPDAIDYKQSYTQPRSQNRLQKLAAGLQLIYRGVAYTI